MTLPDAAVQRAQERISELPAIRGLGTKATRVVAWAAVEASGAQELAEALREIVNLDEQLRCEPFGREAKLLQHIARAALSKWEGEK